MKKFAFILLLVLALALGLTACNQTSPTARVTRWYNQEHYEFAITKADLDSAAQGGYAKEYTVRGEANPKEIDEVAPEDISGTFVMDINVNDKLCTFTTEMTLVSLYSHDYYNKLADSLKDQLNQAGLIVSDDEMRNVWFDDTADGVAIKSTTTTSVTFQNDKAQRPTHSEKVINGYYFGATTQEVSASKVVVDYNLDKNKVSVAVDDNKAVEKDVKFNKNADVIDSNQLLLYVRSLEKTESSFQDNPSVQVYDPIYNVVRTASFSMTYACQTYISYTHEKTTGEEDNPQTTVVTEPIKAKLTCVAVVIDGQVFMVQMNLPASINNKDSGLDVMKDASSSYNKYTTVRFRSGYKAFELVDYNGLTDANGNKIGAQVVEALQAATATK